MSHYTEEELILHHYGESDHAEAIERHLALAPAVAEWENGGIP